MSVSHFDNMIPLTVEKKHSFVSNVFYWKKDEEKKNFGDYISEILCNELFFPFNPRARGVHIVGSVLDDMFITEINSDARPIVFWGCGLRSSHGLSDENIQKIEILSVRGPLTASILKLGGRVPIGDPGLIIPAFYKPSNIEYLNTKTICIPHYHNKSSDNDIKEATNCDIVLRPYFTDSLAGFYEIIDYIYSAKFVFTASLHGAIIAAAYGKPFAFWDQNNEIDLPFKWADFSASIGIKPAFFSTVKNGITFYEKHIKKYITIPSLLPAISRPPLPLRPSGLVKILAHEFNRTAEQSTLKLFAGKILDNKILANKYIDSQNEIIFELVFSGLKNLHERQQVVDHISHLLSDQKNTNISLINLQKELAASLQNAQNEYNNLREKKETLELDSREKEILLEKYQKDIDNLVIDVEKKDSIIKQLNAIIEYIKNENIDYLKEKKALEKIFDELLNDQKLKVEKISFLQEKMGNMEKNIKRKDKRIEKFIQELSLARSKSSKFKNALILHKKQENKLINQNKNLTAIVLNSASELEKKIKSEEKYLNTIAYLQDQILEKVSYIQEIEIELELRIQQLLTVNQSE